MRSSVHKASRYQWRRRGIAMLYAGLAMPVLLGIAAYVVDMGYLYRRKADIQKAADAAALAGAFELSKSKPYANGNSNNGSNLDTAVGAAHVYARLNGFDDNRVNRQGNKAVQITTAQPWAGHADWFHVVISGEEPVTFANIFGLGQRRVAASATALYAIAVSIPIDPQYYGINTGPVDYTMYGPYGLHSNGDDISVMYLDDGTANANYNGKGYDFTLLVPSDYAARNGTSQVQVEIFDPDCYNVGGLADASSTTVDEIRTGTNQPAGASLYTTTQYSLYYDLDGNPQNPDRNDHILIGQQSYGQNAETDMKWVTPPNFTFDASDNRFQGGGIFRINATTTDGSSENGFNLRAGPPHPTSDVGNGLGGGSNMDETTWHDQLSGAPGTTGAGKNGTSIAAQGNLPMNFNVDGTADILLGNVPAGAQGGQLVVNKFDTDVGAQSVYYTCDSLPGQQFPGTLAGNDQFAADTITLPPNYQGGNWHAIYTAGSNDTSVWSLSYDRGQGTPSGVRLVQ